MYTVQPGDSLTAIAARYHVSVGTLMALNGITDPNLVLAGARLRLPGTAPPPIPVGQYDPQGVRELIASYARQYGIPPAFALAVAWQESGFNQSMVSKTGAIGVMQVEPATGLTISTQLGRSLDLRNLRDNVQAGVYLLAQLDSQYGGDHRLAAAAYYQGPASVSRDGMYDETVRYVNNVMALEGRFAG